MWVKLDTAGLEKICWYVLPTVEQKKLELCDIICLNTKISILFWVREAHNDRYHSKNYVFDLREHEKRFICKKLDTDF